MYVCILIYDCGFIITTVYMYVSVYISYQNAIISLLLRYLLLLGSEIEKGYLQIY